MQKCGTVAYHRVRTASVKSWNFGVLETGQSPEILTCESRNFSIFRQLIHLDAGSKISSAVRRFLQ